MIQTKKKVDPSSLIKNQWFVLVLATLCFGVALYCRNILNIWAMTTLVSAVIFLSVKVKVPSLLPQAFNLKNALWGTFCGLAMALFTWWFYPYAVEIYPGLSFKVAMLYDNVHEPPGPILSIPLLIGIVFVEELIWRKLAIQRLSSHFSKPVTIILASLVYALPQLASGSIVLVFLAGACGIVWSAQSVFSKGISVSYFTHMTWNILVMIMFPLE